MSKRVPYISVALRGEDASNLIGHLLRNDGLLHFDRHVVEPVIMVDFEEITEAEKPEDV